MVILLPSSAFVFLAGDHSSPYVNVNHVFRRGHEALKTDGAGSRRGMNTGIDKSRLAGLRENGKAEDGND
jgi:hypothetical protein